MNRASAGFSFKEYQRRMHIFGKVTNIIACAALIAVPLAAGLIFDLSVDWGRTIRGFLGVFSLFGILTVIEFTTYAPIMGPGATYLTFLTGNTINMKLPSSVSSVKIAGVEPGSPEAELISTIAVAVSSLVTLLVLILGLFGLSFLLPLLQHPVLQPAFDNLIPAIMGALGVPLMLRDPKTAAVPAGLALVLTLVLGRPAMSSAQAILLPLFLAITLAWRYLRHKGERAHEAAAAKRHHTDTTA
jgi:hypothetical protein